MKRLLSYFLLAGVLALVATSCYQEEIDNLQKQIDDLTGSSIATIDSQIKNINASITDLQSVENSLSGYITSLQSDNSKIKGQIEDLTAADKSLSTKIDELKSFVNGELKSSKDWANATFATLAQYDSLATVVAGIPAKIDALGDAKSEIIAGYEKAIKDAVEASEESMKSWVNEKLTDYYTIAQLNATLDSLGQAQSAFDSTINAKIDEQKVALDTAKSQITAAYQAAIKTAVDSLEGRINTKLAQDIATAQSTLNGQITAINTEITNIKSRLDAAESNINALIARIQSVTVIPSYNDGSVKVASCGYVDTISFDIHPTAVADSIAKAWKNTTDEARKSMVAFTIKEVMTKGQAVASATVDTVFFKDDEFKVGVKFENLPTNAMTSLHITSDKSELSSEYFLLNVVDITGQHGFLNGQEYVLIKAKYDGTKDSYLKWATQNLAVTASGQAKWKSTIYQIGDYFQWAASYDGYGLITVPFKVPSNLVIYDSFINTFTTEGNSFAFKTGKETGFGEDINAPYCDGTNYTKYTSGSATLDITDDVANIVLGDTWRMPTGGSAGEFKAMRAVTYWARDDTDKGYYVFKPGFGTSGAANGTGKIAVTDDKTKALLFFPVAGLVSGTNLYNAGNDGCYWSSTRFSGNANYAYSLNCNSLEVGPDCHSYRYFGFPVRPVSE